MATDLTTVVQLELKYCERCGGLWLRQPGSNAVYCRTCLLVLAEFPTVRPPSRRNGKRRSQPAHPEQLRPPGRSYCMNAIIASLCAEYQQPAKQEWNNDPDLWIYRDRTIALLRRYLYLSVEIGRLPSLLGREFFRARVSSYRVTTFEDAVIFVHDVERSIEHLDDFSRQLIARVVLQEYTEWEAAHLLHCSVRTIQRLLPDALDQLTAAFLSGSLLTPIGERPAPYSCQHGETQQSSASCCASNK